MPILIAAVVVSFVAGLVARPPVARSIAVGLGLLVNAVFVWAIADGQGDDPVWLIAMSVVAAILALGAAQVGGRLRRTEQPV